MSNQVMNAIDTGLRGLRVTERDVAVILRKARTDQPVQRRPRHQWGVAMVLAAVLLMLVAGAGVRMLAGVPEATPLSPNEGQTAPGNLTEETPLETAEPEIRISSHEAIALAENHVHTLDPGVDLRAGTVYEISCEWTRQERQGNSWLTNFYKVRFAALDAFGTEYTVRVKADSGLIAGCDVQRGAGEGHTAQEIYIGYARVYGPDRRQWSQEELRTYITMLRKARSDSKGWMDLLYLQSSYPDVPEDIMSREKVLAAAENTLESMLFRVKSDMDGHYWTLHEQVGDFRVRLLGGYPNPVWKVAVDLELINEDNLHCAKTLLAEIESKSGTVMELQLVDTLLAEQHESFLKSTCDALMQVSGDEHLPEITLEEKKAAAAAWAASCWGETRDINDESLFSLETGFSDVGFDQALYQCGVPLVYRSLDEGTKTEYIVYVNNYGEVLSANASTVPAGDSRGFFTPTAIRMDWSADILQTWQETGRQSAMQEKPEVQVFLNTLYAGDYHPGIPQSVLNAAHRAVNSRMALHVMAVRIAHDPNDVWKLAIENDSGNYLVEVDSVTCEVISVMRVKSLYESWYLPFVLTEDLQEAGVPLVWDVAQNFTEEAVDAGTVYGQRVDHLLSRFRSIYGPNMGNWSQEQLRMFQQAAILSCDYDYDLAIPCLRDTVYPDVPEDAISRSDAMLKAASAVGAGDWAPVGSVLLGTESTPVWKVCIRVPDGDRSTYWYAEVNCITGSLLRIHQKADKPGSPGETYDYGVPQSLWFRDIVLEDTIEECSGSWDCKGNG